MRVTVGLLILCVLSATAAPVAEDERVSGENGWYIPQSDGTIEWMYKHEAEAMLEELRKMEPRLGNKVKFYLYTKDNVKKPQEIEPKIASILASNFNPSNPTRITIHGWNSNFQDGLASGVRDACFLQGNCNIIATDWAGGRSLEYASSVIAAPKAGAKVAALIDHLHQEHNVPLSTVELIGFSLGAHVAGYAAKNVQAGQVQKVTGLDPAMPFISYENCEKRLCSTDAVYVESIQTSGGMLGYKQPIGTAAFYPNGGRTQPGCGIDLTGGCAHGRSFTYWYEAQILNSFATKKCATYADALNKDCGDTYSTVRMGAESNIYVAKGEFYVPINKQSPYGMAAV